jgi:hypothetical protein
MRFEVLMAVKISMLFLWVKIFSPEYGGSMFLRNFSVYLQVYTVLQPRRSTSTNKGLLSFQILLAIY